MARHEGTVRILHLDTGREMRGGQHQTLLLHKSLAKHDCEQTLLAGPAIRAQHGFAPTTWSSIRQHAPNCDLIHAHDARAHTLALLHGSGKPVVVARRVAFAIGRGPASKWKYRKAAHFIAISRHVARTLAAGGVPPEKVSVVYDAAPDEEIFRPHEFNDPADEPPRPSGFVVVTPNSDDPLKGRDLAIEACRRSAVELVASDNLARDIPGADLLLYLSRSEGLGSAILIAMLAGLPAIASNVGGIPEAVEDGITGLLVENDSAAIAAAIRRLREDRGLRERMSKAALAKVKLKFNCETMAEQTARVYARMLRPGRIPRHEGPP